MATKRAPKGLIPLLQHPSYRAFVERYASDLARFSIEVCGVSPTWQQLEFFESVQNPGSRTSVSSGHGCFAAGTLAMRADGSPVAVEDVKVGDRLMGPDGASVRNVTELKRGRQPMYRFTLNDGSSYTFNLSHDLCLEATNSKGTRKTGDRIIVSVEEWLTWAPGKRRCWAFYRSPVHHFDGAADVLPVPPYILGLWLGDGDSARTAITTGDREIDEAFSGYAEGLGLQVHRTPNSANSWRVVAAGKGGSNAMLSAFREAGAGICERKSIPRAYLTASMEARLELLAGLLDTDGHLDRNGASFDFVQKCERTARDVEWLARSVGCHATTKRVEKGCQTGAVGTYWRVMIGRNIDRIPTRLARFRERLTGPRQRTMLRHGIRSVECLGEGDYFGFQLDGDRRFLLHDFTVQKNTGKTQGAAVVCLWHLLCYALSNTILSGPKLDIVLSGVRKYVADIHAQITAGPQAWVAEYVVVAHKSFYVKGHKSQWWVQAKTAPAGKPEAMAGEHRKFLLWLIDEASGVDDKIMGIIMGSVTEKWNRVALMSQPTRGAGFFFDTHHRLSRGRGGPWNNIVMSSEDSPLVDDNFIREKLQQYGGRNDPQYQIKVLGRFPEDAEGQLLSRPQLEACLSRPCVIKAGEEWGWVITVDVAAGEFRDKSVVMVAKVSGHGQFHEKSPRRVHVHELPVMSGAIQPTDLIGEVVQVAARYPGAIVMIDAVGMGLFVYKKLEELSLPGLVKVNWGIPCWRKSLKESYFNQRAQGMVCMARSAKAGHLSISPSCFRSRKDRDEFLDQAAIPYSFTDAGQYRIAPKGSKEWEGRPSPDMIDALSFDFLESAQYIPCQDGMAEAGGSSVVASAVDALRARLAQRAAAAGATTSN